MVEQIIELLFMRSEKGIQELDAKYGRLLYKLSYNIVNNIQDASNGYPVKELTEINSTVPVGQYTGIYESLPQTVMF